MLPDLSRQQSDLWFALQGRLVTDNKGHKTGLPAGTSLNPTATELVAVAWSPKRGAELLSEAHQHGTEPPFSVAENAALGLWLGFRNTAWGLAFGAPKTPPGAHFWDPKAQHQSLLSSYENMGLSFQFWSPKGST